MRPGRGELPRLAARATGGTGRNLGWQGLGGREDVDMDKDDDLGNDTHGSKIIVLPFDGATFDQETGVAGCAGGSGQGGGREENCNCRTAPSHDGYGRLFGLVGLCFLAVRRRRARR